MDPLTVFEIITATIHCFKDGMDLFFKATEHYEKYRKKPSPEKRGQIIFQSDVIPVYAHPAPGNIKKQSGYVSLYISSQLYYPGLQRGMLQQNDLMRINPFYDTEDLSQLPSIILEHPKDSLIVIRSNYKNNDLTLQFEMLNIIPGNDDLCYRMSCQAKCDLTSADYVTIANSLLEETVTEIMRAYAKYQKPVSESIDRLELEARILREQGYTNISYKKIDMGYGLDIQLGFKKIVIGIPDEYPRKAPTVVLIHDDSYVEIEFETDWEPFMTIGHIVTAIKNEEQKLC